MEAETDGAGGKCSVVGVKGVAAAAQVVTGRWVGVVLRVGVAVAAGHCRTHEL